MTILHSIIQNPETLLTLFRTPGFREGVKIGKALGVVATPKGSGLEILHLAIGEAISDLRQKGDPAWTRYAERAVEIFRKNELSICPTQMQILLDGASGAIKLKKSEGFKFKVVLPEAVSSPQSFLSHIEVQGINKQITTHSFSLGESGDKLFQIPYLIEDLILNHSDNTRAETRFIRNFRRVEMLKRTFLLNENDISPNAHINGLTSKIGGFSNYKLFELTLDSILNKNRVVPDHTLSSNSLDELFQMPQFKVLAESAKRLVLVAYDGDKICGAKHVQWGIQNQINFGWNQIRFLINDISDQLDFP
jgi:hypothetical protein